MARNERPQEYIYNTGGVFTSSGGDYLGLNAGADSVRSYTNISFVGDKYMHTQTYEDAAGISRTAYAAPTAEKIEEIAVNQAAADAWKARNDTEYLLVSEKYSSIGYISAPIAKTLTDERIYGYVDNGIYRGGGRSFNAARITGADEARGYQSTPTMMGRDTNDLSVERRGGYEYLRINNTVYVESASAIKFSGVDLSGNIAVGAETLWIDVDAASGGKQIYITAPPNGAWFAYDERMNCIASSLEKNPRTMLTLPDGGRLALAGETGAEFTLR
jgi:hypothetical protein